MLRLAEIQAQEAEYIKHQGGYWEIGEFNPQINKFSRAKVRAFRRERGQAWLGNINLDDYTAPNFQKYAKGMVYNFQYHLILPTDDDQLKKMIQDRIDAPYTGTKADSDRLDPIFDRLYSIGGICLNWV